MILGVGDCNMRGAEKFRGETYLELIQKELKEKVLNFGVTMSTTREGKIISKKFKAEVVIVAYGLVDSWKTFKYAPYVLYYPDNLFRKVARKVVKKYKKTARRLGLNQLLGEKFVVPPKEYEENLYSILQNSKKALLLETPPHHRQTFRNPNIQLYNSLLKKVTQNRKNTHLIELYDLFLEDITLYLDDIHFNQKGHDLIAEKILRELKG